ncbi:MAG: ribulose-phosphate 3-epimerase [Candidatus Azambacteria bacterium]|nr:ribulose-phosphate 3-epimerase [Candidatus Azambacteria bacterium]
MNTTQIIPALIVSDKDIYNDFQELKDKFERLRPFLAEFDNWVQIDITDGEFVTSKTNISFEELAYFTKLVNVEFHLMVIRLQQSIEKWIELGPKRIIFHIEAYESEDINSIIKKCQQAQIEVGLALNPETPSSSIKPWLEKIDSVMFMGVHPGRGGQPFLSDTATKIGLLRYNHPNIKIEVDGGVRVENIRQLKEAGADIFVVGSGLFVAPDVGQAIKDLKSALS